MPTGPTIVVQSIGGPDCQVLFEATSAYLEQLDLPPWQSVEAVLPDVPPDCWLLVGRTEAKQALQDGYLVDLDLHNPDDLRHPVFRHWRQEHPQAIPAAARAAAKARVILCQTTETGLESHEASYAETIGRRIGLWARFWNREAEPTVSQPIATALPVPLKTPLSKTAAAN